MELILTQDVENLGFKDDMVTVKNGYGRNYLIPGGQAILATSSAKKVLAENLKQRAHKEAKIVADANKSAEAIKNIELKIAAKAGKTGKLFGAITNISVSEGLAKLGHAIDKKFIQINGGSVKTIGKASAKVRLHRSVNIEFEFEVVAIEK